MHQSRDSTSACGEDFSEAAVPLQRPMLEKFMKNCRL